MYSLGGQLSFVVLRGCLFDDARSCHALALEVRDAAAVDLDEWDAELEESVRTPANELQRPFRHN